MINEPRAATIINSFFAIVVPSRTNCWLVLRLLFRCDSQTFSFVHLLVACFWRCIKLGLFEFPERLPPSFPSLFFICVRAISSCSLPTCFWLIDGILQRCFNGRYHSSIADFWRCFKLDLFEFSERFLSSFLSLFFIYVPAISSCS